MIIKRVITCGLRESRTYIRYPIRGRSSAASEASMFIDYVEVNVQGGKGGGGCASMAHMLRNKRKPDGADGGRGGSVVFKGCKTKHDLSHVPEKMTGGTGGLGLGSNKTGKHGGDAIIPVPVGSIIGLQQDQKPLVELGEGDTFVAAKGGAGGMGNVSMANKSMGLRSRCRDREDGHQDEMLEYYLEMKMIADIGLVGLPNAGKSSLLRAISAARPKVAAYPFTTMRPHVGVIHYDGYYRVTMADIPGLIEGSSLGFGLGISFLKHIERCQSLLYVVDMSNDAPSEPVETVNILEKELTAFKPGMSDTVVGIVANKIDLLHGPEPIINLGKHFPQYPIVPMSALHQRNIASVRNLLDRFKSPHKVLHTFKHF